MSRSPDPEVFFEKAKEKAKKHYWMEAAGLYAQVLGSTRKEDSLRLGTVQEEIGACLYWASMQSESREIFEERTRQAITEYEKAQEFYRVLPEEQKSARILRCRSICKYLESRLVYDQPEKKKLLTDCFKMAAKALAIFSRNEDKLQYGITYNALSFLPLTAFFDRAMCEHDRRAMKVVVEKGLQWGEKTLAIFSELGDKHRFATAYITWITCQLIFEWFFISEPEEQDNHNLEVMGHLGKLLDFSTEIGDTYLVGMTHFWLGDNTTGEESVKHLKKALKAGKKTRSKFCQASPIDFMANRTYWKAIVEEVPDQRKKLAEKAMDFYDKAQHLYSIVPFKTPRGGLVCPPGGHAEHCFHLAEWETDLDRKKKLLEKAEKTGIQALKEAEQFYPLNVVSFTLNILSRVLEARGRLEPDISEKRNLLERAARHEERAIQYSGWKPYVYWNVGLMHSFLADLKAELGYLERAPNNRKKLLEQAALGKEECLKLIARQEAPYYQLKGVRVPFIGLYRYQDTYGTLLNNLYELTRNPQHLRRAIEISQKALEWHNKLGTVSLVAESYWRIAKAQDILEEHSEAAENFQNASKNYLKTAEKIPQLRDFYEAQASYMQAWSEIEKARHHHRKQEYDPAMEHFEKTADLHKSSKQWSYLAPNYSAWAHLEHAEDLSKEERSDEALQAFEQAAALFIDTRKSLQTQLCRIKDLDEKRMATDMLKATEIRHEYCAARMNLEKARILDKQGDHRSSSEKYGSAARTFEKITHLLDSEQEKKELEFISKLSRAWQKMTQAEAEASPELYAEASRFFEESYKLDPNERTKMLALGHSRFCRALEAGTKYADTRDTSMYAASIRHLEIAVDYYVKAGFREASEYAKATGLLFEAYVHLDKAAEESDPEKRAKFCMMAERILQTSAKAFTNAKHPEKKEQIWRLLDKVEEERELAVSLIELLHAPSIISSTESITSPTPTSEKAVGLERFEHADIQANVTVRPRELRVNENLDLEIELVNAGKGSALLTKITEVVPQGFALTHIPETYRMEDSYLNMKGRRLDPLKMEEVKLVLKPKTGGIFSLKPTILYLDEDGKYRSNESEPISITVKELETEALQAPALEISERGTDRVATGCADLDDLLLGGIPPNYAVVLTSSSSDERDMLVESFLETGAKKGEVTFYVTTDPGSAKRLAEEFQSNFFLFVCNAQAGAIVKDLPNVFKLKGVENLTEIGISVTSAVSKLDSSLKGPRRVCIDIISDILLQHHAVQTRRCLSSLIPGLRSEGFTMLAVMDPEMHSPQEARAVLDLFDGEISIYEKETEKGAGKFLKIKKMSNQKYLKDELPLKKEQL